MKRTGDSAKNFLETIVMMVAIAAGLLLSFAARSEDKINPALPPKTLMHEVLKEITALKPYMGSADKFADPKNQAEITRHLDRLAEVTQKASHEPALEKPGFRPSWDILKSHVADTARVFRSGNKTYARWMLNSTLSVCMSCHAQMPSPSKQFWTTDMMNDYTSAFDQAEFLFAIRNFDKAHELYRGLIRGFPKNHSPADQIEAALEREVGYYARIKRDPAAAQSELKDYLENKNLPDYQKKNIASWLKQFAQWSKTPAPDPKTASADEIRKFATKALNSIHEDLETDNPNEVTYMKVSGVLYEYLNLHPDSEITPDILYWLAIADRATSNNFFFSLADLYLKDCMNRFSKNPVAKKCFKEFQESTVASFSGSSGVHVPEDVQAELDHYRALVGIKNEEGEK